jgi:hypothetical protein
MHAVAAIMEARKCCSCRQRAPHLKAVRPAAVGASRHVAAWHGKVAAKFKRADDLTRAAVTHIHHGVQLQAAGRTQRSSRSTSTCDVWPTVDAPACMHQTLASYSLHCTPEPIIGRTVSAVLGIQTLCMLLTSMHCNVFAHKRCQCHDEHTAIPTTQLTANTVVLMPCFWLPTHTHSLCARPAILTMPATVFTRGPTRQHHRNKCDPFLITRDPPIAFSA